VGNAEDIPRAKEAGKVAVILGFQNAKPVEDDFALIEVFHRLGVRVIQLTYNRRTSIGNGVGERVDDGLSRFGLDVVRALNDARIVIDLAHVGYRSALDAVQASSDPVIISHAAARALCGHFRCVADDLIRAVAMAGGVVGIAALSILLRDDGHTQGAALDDYLRHMEHVISLVGVDHVGLGLDVGFKRTDEDTTRLVAAYPEFKFPPLPLRYATELNRADKIPILTDALVKRSYSQTDIHKILGLNWYRVFSRVWGGSKVIG
jgi:membrane dipeptidase